ncbi:hypothetical protein [Natronorubrum daqingense]|uniref:DUF8119 domain-containing protein n=1 Tax=Natronorubrum daqingense TaxID=588898 RepID=A0A1N6YNC3_9EURY|nr:hypothetical protein [Natronorubrum daqingense]APX95610.1 hypothetical protein BB347_02705 [Natronorubrum daqingense]SIR16113.1 hypothetical protein SAMN05421809_0505 [Natronorubrum daqingense]
MATDDTSTTNRLGDTIRRTVRTIARFVGDLLIVTCWVVFLTLVFLETAWPGWTFYLLLVLGIGLYVSVTATWTNSGSDQ